MILAVGLTPAWQQITCVDSLEPGEVNRARELVATASGKVLNVGLALHGLQAQSKSLAFVGGLYGAAIREEFAANNLSARWISTQTPTRVCTTVLDRANGRATELVENAAPVTPEDLAAFLKAFKEESRTADLTVISGSLPAEAPPNFHSQLIQSAANPKTRHLLDICGPALLSSLQRRPFLVKPNRKELALTLGRDLSSNRALREAMTELVKRGATWCVVTDGGGATRATDGTRFYEFSSVPNSPVVNPIGCGDCFAGGLAFGLSMNQSMPDAIRLGIGAATENLGQLLPARLHREATESLAASVECREV